MPEITAVANVYNEANAIRGWLEMACGGFFDDVLIYHTGPHGEYSNDGTIEACEKWGARIEYGSIDPGFGTVRTQAVRHVRTEWAMLMDADERFHRFAPCLVCIGADDIRQPEMPYNQGDMLRHILDTPDIDGVVTVRRHWHDFTWKRPTQNWVEIHDLQMRILRNVPHVIYSEFPKMHERIIDTRTGAEPRHHRATLPYGPFHDHYHCFFKLQEPEQRLHDIAIYDNLHFEREVPTWNEFETSRVVAG